MLTMVDWSVSIRPFFRQQFNSIQLCGLSALFRLGPLCNCVISCICPTTTTTTTTNNDNNNIYHTWTIGSSVLPFVWMILLASQSGAHKRGAFRDFQPNPHSPVPLILIAFDHLCWKLICQFHKDFIFLCILASINLFLRNNFFAKSSSSSSADYPLQRECQNLTAQEGKRRRCSKNQSDNFCIKLNSRVVLDDGVIMIMTIWQKKKF